MNNGAKIDGRTRNRIAAMRRVQDVALALFEADGFVAVTVEQIAAAAEVGPATVYRNFVTKEGIVLWDEYDPMILDAVASHLESRPGWAAVRGAILASLDQIESKARRRILRRSRLVLANSALQAARAGEREKLRSQLAQLFLRAGFAEDALAADVEAGAILATMEAGMVDWVRSNGRSQLRDVMTHAFACLSRLRR